MKNTWPVGSAVGVGVSNGVRNAALSPLGLTGAAVSQFEAMSGTCVVRFRRLLLPCTLLHTV